MEAIYFGNIKVWGYGTGNGPWIMADMGTGCIRGPTRAATPSDPTTSYRFTTAAIEGEPNQWAILGGNAQSGGLATDFSGVRPGGYNPMHKEGAIILGIGGDNSKGSAGTLARRLVVGPHRDGGQAQFIEQPIPDASSRRLGPALPVAAGTRTRLPAGAPGSRGPAPTWLSCSCWRSPWCRCST